MALWRIKILYNSAHSRQMILSDTESLRRKLDFLLLMHTEGSGKLNISMQLVATSLDLHCVPTNMYVILIKNLYLSKQYGARRLLSELPDKGWKLGSIDSQLKRSHKTGTVQLSSNQPAVDRVCRVAVKDHAQSGGQAKKASVSSLDFP